jgi:outer membrane protein TolC
VYRARAELADVEQRRAEAVRGQAAAARYLAFLLGRPEDAPAPVFPDSLLDAGPEPSLDAALASALARREELRQADAGVRAAQAQGRLASAAFLPGVALAVDLGVQGDGLRLDGDDDFAVASLTLNWNLYNGGQDAARRGMARLDGERARVRRAEAERQILLQVREAHDAVAQSRDAIRTAEARHAAARRSFELSSRRHAQGLAPQVEFLDARVALTSAALNEILTRYEYLLRRVELERAAALRTFEP